MLIFKSTRHITSLRSRILNSLTNCVHQVDLRDIRMSVKPTIAIIGCGAAGMSAASRLIENNFDDIIMLEAEDRICGRVHSVDFADNTVDLGAQWCHGEKDNIVYEIVKDMNLLEPSFNDYQDNTYYHSSGKVIDKKLTDRIMKVIADIGVNEEAANDFNGTVGDYFLSQYREKIIKEFGCNQAMQEISSEILDWFHKFVLCLESAPSWFDIPAADRSYKECEGDLLLQWKGKGFKTVFDILQKTSSSEENATHSSDKIHLNKEVIEIQWNNNEKSGVIVKCQDGTSYSVDHVVITVSLGVLKKYHATLFNPKLPSFKVNAIEGLSFGTVSKVFLRFPKKWWPNDVKGFSLVWSERDKFNIKQEFPEGPSRNERSWLEDVFGFYVIDHQPNVLMAWIVGEMAGEVELIPDETVINGCVYLLEKFVSPSYDICIPIEILRSKWHSNTHFLGCYSYISMETIRRKTSNEDLAAPLTSSNGKKPALLFAGEATHNHYFSTVHGAIESGYREANRIIDMYK